MFEVEVRHGNIQKHECDLEIISSFEGSYQNITHLSLIPWGEHCTECAVPACYKTCDLYEPRSDNLCRRFVNGIIPIDHVKNILGYIVKIDFKRWGKLMAYGNTFLVPLNRAKLIERFTLKLDQAASNLPTTQWPRRKGRTGIFSPAVYGLKKQVTRAGIFSSDTTPSYFFIEAYNPSDKNVDLSVALSPSQSTSFQKKVVLVPGMNKCKIPFSEMSGLIHPNEKIVMSIVPNILTKEEEGLTLYFGLVGFVKDVDYKEKTKHIKVVVWDLDNTVWNGVLIEKGSNGVELNPKAKQVIIELDKRGIVNSVASKNDYQTAWSQLKQFGLSEYIVFPKINWDPKSENIHKTVQDFNVNVDTFAFIDDQPFEREQVKVTLPGIRVYADNEIDTLLGRPEFNPPISSETAGRREFYLTQGQRSSYEKQFGNYLEFLRNCNIKLDVIKARDQHIERIYELCQRTNQLNFSGNRYTIEQVQQLISDDQKHVFALECTDKFGTYGTVGVCVVDISYPQTPKLIDLMFSCRVQAKRVEHAFLQFIIQFYANNGAIQFNAMWKKTEKNQPSGKVFNDMQFKEIGESNGVTSLVFDSMSAIPNDNIIDISFKD